MYSTLDLLPKRPDMVLTAINVSTLGLKAVGICSNVKTEKQTKYNFRRPKVSDKGAKINGPMPSKTTNPVVAPTTVVSVVLRYVAICLIPGVNIELANGLRTDKEVRRTSDCIADAVTN